jgi:gliding motility-associated peptidyl-prolyl isomerase
MKFKTILVFISLSFLLVSCFQEPEARKPISKAGGSYIKKSVSKNKAILEQEIALIDSITRQLNDSLIVSTHGFRYYFDYTNPQAGPKPKIGNEVVYSYQVSSLNDQLLYSYENTGNKSYKIEREDHLIGLRHAIKLMSVGDTATFYFPSHLVYGYVGDQNKIGINMPLKYQITLKEINQLNINN